MEKKRKRWPWIVGIIVLLAIIGAAMSGGSDGSGSSDKK